MIFATVVRRLPEYIAIQWDGKKDTAAEIRRFIDSRCKTEVKSISIGVTYNTLHVEMSKLGGPDYTETFVRQIEKGHFIIIPPGKRPQYPEVMGPKVFAARFTTSPGGYSHKDEANEQ